MAVADVDLAFLHSALLVENRTDSLPAPHLHIERATLIHIAATAEHHATLRTPGVDGAAWWMPMKACTNAELHGMGQTEQRRTEGHPVWVHGSAFGASWVMANDISVAAIDEEIDAVVEGRTIDVRNPWNTLGHDGLH